jgi:GT2 family glycosyltransferase
LKKNYRHKISVIIVNYNVEFFLEQCLNSVREALSFVDGQVFVVDNNSIDGSVEMVKNKFPEVNLIANKDNKGFSKANNQAIELSDAEYILLLNPDTVIEEDTLSKVCQFMDAHKEAGGLGVRMLDGKGKFLPESKRGLPTPAVAFYKIFGLSKLFPKSKRFGQYHLGHLSEFKTNEIQILSGAFMLMRSEALDKVGLLDETFFMYGEDIDLSYRIIKGGYKNYYFPETRIIHYKGESTKKSSVNYVFVFYRAMVIFAQKHFSQKNAKLFSFLINCAIYFRAGLAIMSRILKSIILPLIDLSIILAGLYILTYKWSAENIDFPERILHLAIPLYALIWIISVLTNGGYDKPIKLWNIFRGIAFGTLIILVIYALLPKEWQFSRLYILLGASYVFFYFLMSRLVLHFTYSSKFNLSRKHAKRFAIVGSKKEFNRVSQLLNQTLPHIEDTYWVCLDDFKEENAIGSIHQLDQITQIFNIDEIIFCAKDNTANTIISWMSIIDSSKIDFKIAQPDSLYLIGSNSIETAGDLYVVNINAISNATSQRNKRIFDLTFSFLLLIIYPLLFLCYDNKRKLLINLLKIFSGNYSFVGYANSRIDKTQLPRIKKGILNPSDSLIIKDESLTDKMNLLYARDYRVGLDIRIVLKSFKFLDR